MDNSWWDPDEMPTQQAAITERTGYDGTDEYDPLGDDIWTFRPMRHCQRRYFRRRPNDTLRPGRHVQIQNWTAGRQRNLRVDSPAPARVALRLLNYPAWRVEVNGAAIVAGATGRFQPDGDSGGGGEFRDSRALCAHAGPHRWDMLISMLSVIAGDCYCCWWLGFAAPLEPDVHATRCLPC